MTTKIKTTASVRNRRRASRAQEAINHYFEVEGEQCDPHDWKADCTDLLTDLMHLATIRGEDFYKLIRMAQINFDVELKGEDQE